MCGRYTLFTSAAELEAGFGASFAAHEPRYNCAPGQELPVITDEEPTAATPMEWGITPGWADEPFGLINARAETVREKRSFADAFERRRCLVPADGFYEWVEGDDGKTPYRVAFEDDRPFAMAGLYERWEPPEPETAQMELDAFGGAKRAEPDRTEPERADPDRARAGHTSDVLETFAVLTTEPNDVVSDLHHRMAVILDPDDEGTWLEGDPDAVTRLLEPNSGDEMAAFPVSTRVNSPANDGPELVEPRG